MNLLSSILFLLQSLTITETVFDFPWGWLLFRMSLYNTIFSFSPFLSFIIQLILIPHTVWKVRRLDTPQSFHSLLSFSPDCRGLKAHVEPSYNAVFALVSEELVVLSVLLFLLFYSSPPKIEVCLSLRGLFIWVCLFCILVSGRQPCSPWPTASCFFFCSVIFFLSEKTALCLPLAEMLLPYREQEEC